MELENIVANTVYLKAREGLSQFCLSAFSLNCVLIVISNQHLDAGKFWRS